MTKIELSTIINAPVESCFDLARSIDLHVDSMAHTGEEAIAGCTSGLIGLNDSVTWRAKHFGIWLTLTSKITEFNFPNSFTDEMIEGVFKSMQHQHVFKVVNGQTIMKDIFIFESPCGMWGKLANFFFLSRYMKKLLITRNEIIKTAAENTRS